MYSPDTQLELEDPNPYVRMRAVLSTISEYTWTRKVTPEIARELDPIELPVCRLTDNRRYTSRKARRAFGTKEVRLAIARAKVKFESVPDTEPVQRALTVLLDMPWLR